MKSAALSKKVILEVRFNDLQTIQAFTTRKGKAYKDQIPYRYSKLEYHMPLGLMLVTE
jgi:hypothetical protein